jgi:hypothetical protein
MKRGEIVNHLDFDRHLMVRQHNEEVLREVRVLREWRSRNSSSA